MCRGARLKVSCVWSNELLYESAVFLNDSCRVNKMDQETVLMLERSLEGLHSAQSCNELNYPVMRPEMWLLWATSCCVACAGSRTGTGWAKSFLPYCAVFILLELVTVAGNKIGRQLKCWMEFYLHPVSEVWHLLGGSRVSFCGLC